MNYLEELEFAHGVPEQELECIQNQLRPVLFETQKLMKESEMLAINVRRFIGQDQIAIISDIYEAASESIKPNEKLLHECLHKEKELSVKIDRLRSGKHLNERIKLQKDRKEAASALRLQIIEELEQIDFPQIAKIRKIEEVWANSFHKIWIWVLEVYFGYPSSKYDWEDFREKALTSRNDKGKELKRRMIVHDPSTLSMFQASELEDIVRSHRRLLMDKTNVPDLNKFLQVLTMIFREYQMSKIWEKDLADNKFSSDMQKMREEEEKTLMASQKLNQTRFDLITEVHNLLQLIETEFYQSNA